MFSENIATIQFIDRNKQPSYLVCHLWSTSSRNYDVIKCAPIEQVGRRIHASKLEHALGIAIKEYNMEKSCFYHDRHYAIDNWAKRMEKLYALFEAVMNHSPVADWTVFDRYGMPVGFRDNTSESYLTICYLGRDIDRVLKEVTNNPDYEDPKLLIYDGDDIQNDDGTYGWRHHLVSETNLYKRYGLRAIDTEQTLDLNHFPKDDVPILQSYNFDDRRLGQVVTSQWKNGIEVFNIYLGVKPNDQLYGASHLESVTELTANFSGSKLPDYEGHFSHIKELGQEDWWWIGYEIMDENVNLQDVLNIIEEISIDFQKYNRQSKNTDKENWEYT